MREYYFRTELEIERQRGQRELVTRTSFLGVDWTNVFETPRPPYFGILFLFKTNYRLRVKCLKSSVPVSYTHLDVYKRQAKHVV